MVAARKQRRRTWGVKPRPRMCHQECSSQYKRYCDSNQQKMTNVDGMDVRMKKVKDAIYAPDKVYLCKADASV